MSWMKYNKETRQIDLLPYISEFSDFQAIVMDEHTWNVICKRSASAAPGKVKGRKTKFLASLFALLKTQDETHPIMEHAYDYVLHIELSADETNAIISLQRKATYEFVFRNEIIPLSGK
jgi:hypothetical protein